MNSKQTIPTNQQVADIFKSYGSLDILYNVSGGPDPIRIKAGANIDLTKLNRWILKVRPVTSMSDDEAAILTQTFNDIFREHDEHETFVEEIKEGDWDKLMNAVPGPIYDLLRRMGFATPQTFPGVYYSIDRLVELQIYEMLE